MASTQPAILARITTLISDLTPTSDVGVPFRSSRNEGAAEFMAEWEAAPTAALRRFQAIDDGTEDPPEVSDTLVDLRHFTAIVLVAYPHTGRYIDAIGRRRVIDEDWGKVNGTGGIGIYSRAQFSGTHDCTPLGAEREIVRGTSCDFLEVRARFSYYRAV